MGTPEFAAAHLSALHEHDVCLVVTQPDRPQGRKRIITPPAVKVVAQEAGIPIIQPKSWKKGDAAARVLAANADAIVVVAYGRLLPDEVLLSAQYGSVNVHASLLPKYRGAAPIQWAVARGETKTGITTMRMASQLDAGDILYAQEVDIAPQDTSASLREKLKDVGCRLLLKTLERLPLDPSWGTVQDESQVTFAPPLSRADGILDPFRQSAEQMHNIVRAFGEEPGAFWNDFRILQTQVEEGNLMPGQVLPIGILVGADGQNLRILRLQAPGKKPMAFSEYVRGNVF
jgi:methionyl-tRNA formyltransferase